jgi:hypothetical protein
MTPAGPLRAPGDGGNGHKRPEIKLRMSDQVAAGVYANSMMVHHTPDEFILDFALMTGGSGQVVARVITSPGHMKKVIAALEENIRKYEALHGPAEPSEAGG